MKKLLVVSIMVLCFVGVALATNYESITVTNVAIGFTAAKLKSSGVYSRSALCTLETAQIRFRVDGTDPTSAEGHIMEVGQVWKFTTNELVGFKAIRTTGTSGVLKCTYE
jgi:hypothetical protein